MSSPLDVTTWVTAMLDRPQDEVGATTTFWAAVTGYDLSPTRGPSGEFATFVPPDGDAFLKVQAIGDGPARIHLDVSVESLVPAVVDAESLGASVTRRSEHGYVVLTSPGGLTFCLVPHQERVRPRPTAWPDSGESLVDQVCLDVPPSAYERETAFWAALTGWAFEQHADSEFDSLARPPGAPLRILFQRLDDEQERVTAHLDWATVDRRAEAARHEALGARVLSVHEEWTVLAPPDGSRYCLTDRTP